MKVNSRELCSCGCPIISIDSHLTEPDEKGHIDQVQQMGCRNKNCSRFDMPIRTETNAVNY